MEPDQMKEATRKLLWSVQRSQRYHARRSSFFSRWNKATAFAGIVGGSAVFASLGKALPGEVATLAAAGVVLISGADLVIGAADMARKHNDLKRRFCELEAEVVGVAEPTVSDLNKWKSLRVTIESDEPPTHVALDVLCENELIRSTYEADRAKGYLHPVPIWKRATAHFFTWENT
ncbi:hypothetical protein [Stenotrophomonas bentonitica]|uniref:hypothetical protein n=1 Tax=Stenotrophomonas bentonitica TaxID=1450134 RepID=UPI00345E5E11